MSAASESICESTSHKETISTGDICTSRNRSDFPYHPQPIKPTRRRLSRSYSCAGARAAAANPKAVVWRNSRRFIGIPAKRNQYILCINHDVELESISCSSIMNSSRPVQDANFCFGVWQQTGKLSYYVNPISWQGNDTSFAACQLSPEASCGRGPSCQLSSSLIQEKTSCFLWRVPAGVCGWRESTRDTSFPKRESF